MTHSYALEKLFARLFSLLLVFSLLFAVGCTNNRNPFVDGKPALTSENAEPAIKNKGGRDFKEQVCWIDERLKGGQGAGAAGKILTASKPVLGVDYTFGGKSKEEGFDCSGFTRHVFKELAVDLPPNSAEQSRIGKSVAKNELKPGDLVFFGYDEPVRKIVDSEKKSKGKGKKGADKGKSGKDSASKDKKGKDVAVKNAKAGKGKKVEIVYETRINHVGVYVGDGKMIHASRSAGVTIDNLDGDYFAKRYKGARRLDSVQPQKDGKRS